MSQRPNLELLRDEHLSQLGSSSEKLHVLTSLWSEIDTEVTKHLSSNNLDEAGFSDLEAAQQDILAKLSSLSSQQLVDAVTKLEIWAQAACIDESDQDYLQPLDKLLLSVLNDLRRISSPN